jgi:hypothetical protein
MIPLSLGEIAAVVGGTGEGDGAATVTPPAAPDGRQAHAAASSSYVQKSVHGRKDPW